jgi:hypothetical protein
MKAEGQNFAENIYKEGKTENTVKKMRKKFHYLVINDSPFLPPIKPITPSIGLLTLSPPNRSHNTDVRRRAHRRAGISNSATLSIQVSTLISLGLLRTYLAPLAHRSRRRTRCRSRRHRRFRHSLKRRSSRTVRSPSPTTRSRQSQITANCIQEPRVRIQLTHIPHHDPTKTTKSLTIRNDTRKSAARFVPIASTRRSRDTEDDFHIGIEGHGLRPIIPRSKIKVILRAGTDGEGG